MYIRIYVYIYIYIYVYIIYIYIHTYVRPWIKWLPLKKLPRNRGAQHKRAQDP